MFRSLFTLLYLILTSSLLMGQTLTVNETINYLSEQMDKYKIIKYDDGLGHSTYKSFTFNILTNGFIRMEILEETDNKQFENRHGKTAFFDYQFEYNSIHPVKRNNELFFECNRVPGVFYNPCITSYPQGHTQDEAHISYFNPEGIDKIKNAFDYLLDILKYDSSYNQSDKDPFAKNNYKKYIQIVDSSIKIISLKVEGNIMVLTVSIAGEVVSMVLDSGASDVTISKDLENKLTEKGIITKSDYLDPCLYKLADGRIVTSNRLMIPFLKVGSFVVKNVICSISPTGDVLLLGKSFLDRFSKWSIDNDKHELILVK
jgi:clan AA aspartic protease (TIGR02281 family)